MLCLELLFDLHEVAGTSPVHVGIAIPFTKLPGNTYKILVAIVGRLTSFNFTGIDIPYLFPGVDSQGLHDLVLHVACIAFCEPGLIASKKGDGKVS